MEAALETAGAFLSKMSIIAEEPTLQERVALLLKPTHALVGDAASTASTSAAYTAVAIAHITVECVRHLS